MTVNFNSVVYLCHAIISYFILLKASLVGFSFFAGLSPFFGRSGYVAFKYELVGCLETNRSETVEVLFTCVVYPRFVKTSFDKNRLDESGNLLNRYKPVIGKPLTLESIAREIYSAVIHRKKRILLSPVAKISYYLSWILPDFFQSIMKEKTKSEFVKRKVVNLMD